MESPQPSVVLMGFAQRFNTLQAQRERDDELIKDILVYCQRVERDLQSENARLRADLTDTQLDLEDSKKSRRELQLQVNLLSQRMGQSTAESEYLRNRNPYVMVLVDGDGMIFNDALIRQGIEGGKAAANALRNSVLEHLNELPDDTEVMAKVCANVTGLAKAMKRDGYLDDGDDLRNFTLGFTQGKASFDFVDVGHGKERADSKIKECMRFHIRNHNCKHIFLGISHDAGYAPFLDEILNNDDRRRATILEGPPTVREIASLGLNTLTFGNIFRQDKLVNRHVPTTAPSTWAGVSSIVPPSDTPRIASPTINLKNGATKKSSSAPASTKQSWSPGPRGLDPPIPVNSSALEKIKRRTASNKLCNNHYLRGPCGKGDECTFEHDYKASQDDLNALMWLTRQNPCGNGQECDQEYCIYGHHCPGFSTNHGMGKGEKNEKGELICGIFGCRFGVEGHPPGTVVKIPRKEKWEHESRY